MTDALFAPLPTIDGGFPCVHADVAFLHAYSDVIVARRTPVSTRDPDVTTLAESYAAASWARPS